MLFTSAFRAEVERLRPLWRRRLAEQAFFRRPPRTGDGPDYRDSRPYSPGDDIRRLDWAALMRHDRLQLKRFQERAEPRFLLILDTSPSMAGVWEQALQLTGALACLALEGGATAGLCAGAADAEHTLLGLRGQGAASRALRFLEGLERSASPSALDGLVSAGLARERGAGRGVAVLLSDLYLSLEPGIDRLLAAGYELLVWHLFRPEDGQLSGDGPVRWVDAETGASELRVLDAALRAAYAERWEAFRAFVRRELARRGARCVAAPSDRPWVELVRGFLTGPAAAAV